MITATSSSGNSTDGTGTTRSLPGGALGKDQFLKMLVAQLQHQDPMNPMQGDQMAAQLAQFSSLEQLQQINTTLTSQSSSYGSVLGAIQASAAINTIGRTVIAVGDEVQIGGEQGATSVTAAFGGASKEATLRIYNSAGVEVGSRSLGSVTAGKHTFDIGDAANGLPDGAYTFAIEAKDSNGNAVNVQTYTTGKVDGISSGQYGVMLDIGGISVPYANVIQVK